MAADSDIVAPGALDALTAIASRAAEAILAIRREDLDKRQKSDRSPVTAADLASQATIMRDLAALWPDVPVLSEEAPVSHYEAIGAKRLIAIDPLDGTREFLAGSDEYVVNIAVLDNGVPVAGVVAAPARGVIWRGHTGHGAERLMFRPGGTTEPAQPIHTRARPASGACLVTSRSHPDSATTGYMKKFHEPHRMVCGSALKLCLVAEGSADVYPRLAPISVWDVAAGHAILLAAGGVMLTRDGQALRHSGRSVRLPGFIAAGDHNGLPVA